MTEEEGALPSADATAAASGSKRGAAGRITSSAPAFMLVWGIVWLLGFGALWLVDGVDSAFSLPMAVAVCAGLIAIAVIVSVVLSIRARRGVRGDAASALSGTVRGATWIVGIMAIVVLVQSLLASWTDREPDHVFYPVAFVLCTGIMFVIGSVIWKALRMLVIGLWLVLVALTATFFGHPEHYLVLALGGGAGFLALAVGCAVHVVNLQRAAKEQRA